MSELYLTLRSRLEEVTNWVILGEEVMRGARDGKGLSREAVGRQLNVSAKTYERWEQAGRVPRNDLERVAAVIGLRIESPFDDENHVVVVDDEDATPRLALLEQRMEALERAAEERDERIESKMDELLRLLRGSSAGSQA